ncbi:hypothetical protein BAUCODRAFT_465326 [Baudoinia panamericana UAMH 10762]|uniref:Uncharacterized protein n=1 Tax=Baudoinia panamericana (strain UAMH 10762) TaxID=717646 RepID=M2MX98_BAUPA|nr:uncharacterized protein BAUCODRAFT_465326 [Baudoinia panamericana UAMH 10762]EMC96178.1 hypothetical protein BAUCODRAFT_465326 [Baudoinia panamericana UAMH 10762]
MDLAIIGKDLTAAVLKALSQAKTEDAPVDYVKLGSELVSLAPSPRFEQSATYGRNIFPFEKLPPELRRNVYRIAFTAEGHIKIMMHFKDSPFVKNKFKRWVTDAQHAKLYAPPPPRSCAEATIITKTEATSPYTSTSRADPLRQSSRLATSSTRCPAYGAQHSVTLLRVSRNVLAEAAPELYGANCFTFGNPYCFAKFAVEIRDNAKFLQDITIESINPVHTYRTLLQPLQTTVTLRRLELVLMRPTGRYFCRKPYASTMLWKAIKSLVYGTSKVQCPCGSNVKHQACIWYYRQKRFNAIEINLSNRPYIFETDELIGSSDTLLWTKRSEGVRLKERLRECWRNDPTAMII